MDRLQWREVTQPGRRARRLTKIINYVVTAFSLVSVAALALPGLYAVMSFAVSGRTREIGIRVALLHCA